MSDQDEKPDEPNKKHQGETKPAKRKRRRWSRRVVVTLVVLFVVLLGMRLLAPTAVEWYVNRTIDKSPLYDGRISDVDIHLWRGAYSINDIRLNKVTGNVPAPLFHAKQIDLALQWGALWNGKVVGRILIDEPQLNFADGENEGEDQTGAGGPWLEMLQDLFPFQINSCVVRNGSVHFRAAMTDPPVDLALEDVQASVENLTNIRDEVTPLVATVKASALALGQARLDYQMKINPFSYRPTFQMALRIVGLDVTKTNDLTRAYGKFDFEDGWFDLVVELDSKEGQLEGYVKPIFRNLKIVTLQDVKEDNAIQLFWEALIGTAAGILKNQQRDQVATLVPLTGDISSPSQDFLATLFNVLRNAFIRAYMPRLEGVANDVDNLQFGRGSIVDPPAAEASP